MDDPFAFVEGECGSISASQDALLLHSPFINDSSDDLLLSGAAADTPRLMPHADAPIFICSPPEAAFSPTCASADAGLGPVEEPPLEMTEEKLPAEEQQALMPPVDAPILCSPMETPTSPVRAASIPANAAGDDLGLGPLTKKTEEKSQEEEQHVLMPSADSPILCSPMETPSSRVAAVSITASTVGDDLGLGLPEIASVGKTEEKLPAEEKQGLTGCDSSPMLYVEAPKQASSKKVKKRPKASKKGSMVTSMDSPEVEDIGPEKPKAEPDAGTGTDRSGFKDVFEKYRYHPQQAIKAIISKPQTALKASSSPRKLPVTIQNTGEEKRNAPTAAEVEASGGDPPFPANLLDVMMAFSGEPNMRFENTDILEIAAMKGIHFSPPRWWRPGAYASKNVKHQS